MNAMLMDVGFVN